VSEPTYLSMAKDWLDNEADDEFQSHEIYLMRGLCLEIERLRASVMRYVQQSNACERTGVPCREPARCGCWLEAQTWHTQGDAP